MHRLSEFDASSATFHPPDVCLEPITSFEIEPDSPTELRRIHEFKPTTFKRKIKHLGDDARVTSLPEPHEGGDIDTKALALHWLSNTAIGFAIHTVISLRTPPPSDTIIADCVQNQQLSSLADVPVPDGCCLRQS